MADAPPPVLLPVIFSRPLRCRENQIFPGPLANWLLTARCSGCPDFSPFSLFFSGPLDCGISVRNLQVIETDEFFLLLEPIQFAISFAWGIAPGCQTAL